ncbi:TonB-dependent receptor plug domain-containing protein [Qipengyuania sp. RANM35]|uniref:TonB-dependent receptor plug domain-containing protein n=1 Tax=Qipengyuania sp. RANM35 TaxID=3068635 RepID=UPI0034DABF9E
MSTVLISVPVAAQDDPLTPEVEPVGPRLLESPLPVTVEEVAITVTGNGIGTAIGNTGQSVTIIDRDEIDAVQGADATRVLQRTPGMSLTRNGGIGGFSGVSLRGANSEQLLVLVDGVRVADPASPSGGFDFGNLLLGTAGKFDIQRGSNSTIWGSDAIGGVVDVTTRGTGGLAGNFEYGSRDTLFASAAGGVSDDAYFVGLTGSWFRTDGFSAAASGSERDGFEQVALGGSLFYDVTPGLEVFAHANWSEGKLDIDGFPPPDYALADTLETQETRRHWGDVGFTWSTNDLTLRGAYSLADTERDNFDDAGAESFASDGHSERVQLRGEYRAIGPVTVSFGAEQEWTDFVTSFDTAAKTNIFGAYAQVGVELGRFAAHVGSRIDDHELFGTNGSYGADLSYGFGEDWRVKASLGEGFKAPTLFQLLSFYGNADLQPEESTSFDLGVEKGERGRGTHLALTGFRRDSKDLIGFAFSDARPFGFYDNTARARAQGIEAEAGFDLAEGLRLSGIYSFVDTEDRTSGNDLARRPKHFGTIFADYEAPFGLKLGADLRIVGKSYDDAGNFTRLGGYEVLDLRAAMPVSEAFEVYGRVENVFDTDYQTAAGYASTPRGVFAGVRAKL